MFDTKAPESSSHFQKICVLFEHEEILKKIRARSGRAKTHTNSRLRTDGLPGKSALNKPGKIAPVESKATVNLCSLVESRDILRGKTLYGGRWPYVGDFDSSSRLDARTNQ